MKLHPRVTRSVIELVKRFEGLRRQAARLPDGGWTIGYGHTRSAREGAVVSPADAEALLYYDLSEVAEKVEAWTFSPLNQNQFEALTAFAFNIGLENFRRSTVLKRVNEGQHLMAATAFELWRKADLGGGDLVIDALVRRRAAEKAHYLTPPEGFRPSPTPVLKPAFDHSVSDAADDARAAAAATVVDAPLEGADATATVMAQPEIRDAAPLAAVASAAGAVGASATVHKLFAEDEVRLAPVAPIDAALVVNGGRSNVAPATATSDPISATQPEATSLEAPSAPPPRTEGFAGFTPPPARKSMAAPALLDDASPWMSPFDRPPVRSPFDAIGDSAPQEASVDPAATPVTDPRYAEREAETNAIMNGHRPGPLHNRSMIYFSVGLLGVALFAAALFSMFSGKASPVNLVIGLMGILLMTPAGGYFLLRFLNQRDGLLPG